MTEIERALLFKVARFAKGGQTNRERKMLWEQIEELMHDVEDPREKIHVVFCPSCGWETKARTVRGRLRMTGAHTKATGHMQFEDAWVRRGASDIPF